MIPRKTHSYLRFGTKLVNCICGFPYKWVACEKLGASHVLIFQTSKLKYSTFVANMVVSIFYELFLLVRLHDYYVATKNGSEPFVILNFLQLTWYIVAYGMPILTHFQTIVHWRKLHIFANAFVNLHERLRGNECFPEPLSYKVCISPLTLKLNMCLVLCIRKDHSPNKSTTFFIQTHDYSGYDNSFPKFQTLFEKPGKEIFPDIIILRPEKGSIYIQNAYTSRAFVDVAHILVFCLLLHFSHPGILACN